MNLDSTLSNDTQMFNLRYVKLK